MSASEYEGLKQYRAPVPKAQGVTQSERYLARLAEKSFLNLWSYPAPFRDQQQSGCGDGKELCDLLVVCGRYIVIFSEKTIAWPRGNLTIAWRRWAKRAVRDAAKQAKGAERWITEFSERLFLDRQCETPFPIDLPPPGGENHSQGGGCPRCGGGLQEACSRKFREPNCQSPHSGRSSTGRGG